jgi:hypothetical protein
MLLPRQCDGDQPDPPLTKRQKELRTAVGSATEVACVIVGDETFEFRDGDEESNLAQALAGVSGVTWNDFRHNTLIEMGFDSESFELRRPKRQNDEKVVSAALRQADAALDGIRFNCCRLDVPQMSLGPPGYLPEKGVFALYVHDTEKDEGRMIAYEPANTYSIPGLGMDLDSVSPSPVDSLITTTYQPGSLGVRLQRLLRMYCQSFIAQSDEAKILGNMFAMDGCLAPDNSHSGDFKKFVAMAASQSRAGYAAELDRFTKFYREVRNPLVHHGKSYEELGRDRRLDLFYLQGLLHVILEHLAKSAAEDYNNYWQNAISLANQYA